MRVFCIHCAQPFVITAQQLGRNGRCPHCRQLQSLPQPAGADDHVTTRPVSRWRWLENSLSTLVSLVVHMTLFLAMALLSQGGRGVAGPTAEVLIGSLETEVLSNRPEESLSVEDVAPQPSSPLLNEELEVTPPRVSTANFGPNDDLALGPPSLSGGDSSSFDLGSVATGGGSMSGGSWDGMLQSLRRNGLDIVLTFDSTGSMAGEIQQVKQQLRRIGGTLLKMIPNARISVCTYRDVGDEYLVKGLPLTSDLAELDAFLSRVVANGGGDEPEAVHEGLRWPMSYNEFRPKARKVILLFGDAPPHAEHLQTCLRLASDFNGNRKGVVSTVTCRHAERMREFIEIAYAGGGEAFLTTDEKQIMTQLLVLVFGSQYRSKVVEAFQLLDNK